MSSATTPHIGFKQKLMLALLDSLELGFGFNASIATSAFIVISLHQLLGLDPEVTTVNKAIYVGFLLALTGFIFVAGKNFYKKRINTNRQRWISISFMYVYTMAAFYGLYLVLRFTHGIS